MSPNNNLIYDIGMHNGDDTAYYLDLGYNVVAIDASPHLVELAKLRFSEAIKNSRLEILNVGIAAEEGYLDFYLNKTNSVWNSFDRKIGTRTGAECDVIKIKTVNIQQILNETGVPYFMKIDIEGNDIICLHSLMNCENRPEFISAEVNDFDVLEALKGLGYNKYKLISQFSFLPMELPATAESKTFARRKAFVTSRNFFVRVVRKLFGGVIRYFFDRKYKLLFKYDHPEGSSGPFGESLPGKWLSFEEVSKVYLTYRGIHEHSKHDTGFNFWVDIHATR